MPKKKIIISEAAFKQIVTEGILFENNVVDDVIKSRDFQKRVKELASSTIKDDKELEKKVREIVVKALNNLFKVLWQRKFFYTDSI